MKIGNECVQFNTMKRPYGVSKEDYIKSVKYWRIYAIKQTRLKARHPDVIDETGEVLQIGWYYTYTKNTILWKSHINFTFEEILENPSILTKNGDARGATLMVAYPRERRFNTL